jgi:hypothetical protein
MSTLQKLIKKVRSYECLREPPHHLFLLHPISPRQPAILCLSSIFLSVCQLHNFRKFTKIQFQAMQVSRDTLVKILYNASWVIIQKSFYYHSVWRHGSLNNTYFMSFTNIVGSAANCLGVYCRTSWVSYIGDPDVMLWTVRCHAELKNSSQALDFLSIINPWRCFSVKSSVKMFCWETSLSLGTACTDKLYIEQLYCT